MTWIPFLLLCAWLVPLASFVAILFFGPRMGKHGWAAGHLATAAIVAAGVLSFTSLGVWLRNEGCNPNRAAHAEPAAEHDEGRASPAGEHAEHAEGDAHGHEINPPTVLTGDWYELGTIGKLRLTIGYYIDALTVSMFAMVTLIASCIHLYAQGYMHDELHDITDHEVTLADGNHLHRPGRYHRFFQYLSLFCFSMLGLVVAGNIAMVFVFWELVGICSYFLIGFYIERKSASNAANKAFIVNRVGDFGMLIGMMALWTSLGTFAFGDVGGEKGIFSQVRTPENHYALRPADGMVLSEAGAEIDALYREATAPRVAAVNAEFSVQDREAFTPEFAAARQVAMQAANEETAIQIESALPVWRTQYGYWLLVVAGLGIFCGCVGKSAQFPLHVWLPDAMEGPTPVSALVHSATMVAAGVYLVGRFYPVFAPETLLVIAYTGAITLFLAATIAITATDIKRVLAYSTVSQLGYMMLALGLGGWAAGLFHLITHAFFKSLLFLCSGSVIHACHTNDMTKMGGLRRKMPWTAYTMLIGCLAIVGTPLFSGFFSKDAIVAQALSFWSDNPVHGGVLASAAIGGAAMTAFYMFRLWFLTFAGEPRDHHVDEHVHESPPLMYMPLAALSIFAVGVGWNLFGLSVNNLLEQARYPGEIGLGTWMSTLAYPSEHASHAFHGQATVVASATALAGFLMAVAFYGVRAVSAAEVRQQFGWIYRLLWNKWFFDELYHALFVRPAHAIGGLAAGFDKRALDRLVDASARWTCRLSQFDDLLDRYIVDGAVNLAASWTYAIGQGLRRVQTGKVRQYVMLIVIGTAALTVLLSWAAAWN